MKKRNCRFPTLHESEKAITVVTEYFDDTALSGVLRTYFSSDYNSQSASQADEEKVFEDYKFVFTSAYFQSIDLLYAMAYDLNDSNKNYLVQFQWTTDKALLYEMQGLSENPNETPYYTPNRHLASIIYAQNSDSNNFPVYGYIVGGTQSIWSYNSCQQSDFGLNLSYEQLFASPNSNTRVGYIQKIELDAESCNIEKITDPIEKRISTGVGRDDLNYPVD